MNKYKVVEIGSRGEQDEVITTTTSQTIEEFAQGIFDRYVSNLQRSLQDDPEALEEELEYLKEYGCVNKINDDFVEICYSEEDAVEVHRVEY